MVDGDGQGSKTDVEDFNLEPSIKVVPSTANTGDTVNVFAQDYRTRAGFSLLKIAGQTDRRRRCVSSLHHDREPISIGGDGSVTFEVPGGFEGTCASTPFGAARERWTSAMPGRRLYLRRTARSPSAALS